MDKTKTIIAAILLILAIVIPLVILLAGGGIALWQKTFTQNQPGNGNTTPVNLLNFLWIALAVFVICVVTGVGLLFTVRDLTWLGSSLPFLFGALYSISLVDFIPDITPVISNIDDGAVVTFGAILSLILGLKHDPRTPKWIYIPLFIAAIYTFLGGVFPGGLDELIVQVIAFLTYAYGANKKPPQLPSASASSNGNEGSS